MLDPIHLISPACRGVYSVEIGQQNPACFEANDASRRWQATFASLGLGQLRVEPLSNQLVFPTIDAGHLETAASLKVVGVPARWCDVVVSPRKYLGPANGEQPVD